MRLLAGLVEWLARQLGALQQLGALPVCPPLTQLVAAALALAQLALFDQRSV